ncbi:MAG: 50S ribosome-binding GTPase [Caldilinea sp.]|nr:50S ribosome-binding GTPase [Caldilinea sp.]MDW8440124.1 FeoB small GTPase domain-containing protein [Caldilineaceae bacterium]
MAIEKIFVALAGNPNVGKSTIFNALTGDEQHIGNWPGKTVEKRSGLLRCGCNDMQITVVDLPGAYSLSPYSPEEEIARDFIVEDRPHLVVNVLDAANLERNLYLTTQILETGAPLLVVLNMLDQARARGIQIDAARLSQALGGTPVVELVARRGQGMDVLRDRIVELATAVQSQREGAGSNDYAVGDVQGFQDPERNSCCV